MLKKNGQTDIHLLNLSVIYSYANFLLLLANNVISLYLTLSYSEINVVVDIEGVYCPSRQSTYIIIQCLNKLHRTMIINEIYKRIYDYRL